MKTRSIAAAAVAFCMAFVVCGCNAGGAKPPAGSQISSVETAGEQVAASSNDAVQLPQAASDDGRVAPSSHAYADSEVDVDLAQMSGTAVYSAVYQMMVDPPSYQDKIVKMKGTFYSQYDDSTKKRYYFVVVQDATACCAQGIEFVWDDGEHVYPGDYPAEGAEVVACGRFGTYTERNSQFIYLGESSLALA